MILILEERGEESKEKERLLNCVREKEQLEILIGVGGINY